MDARWRAMRTTDLAAVMDIAAAVHADYPERIEVFAERLSLFPEGCRIAERGGAPVGYGFTHPGLARRPPPLDSLLGALPDPAEVYYLHDIALLASARGAGLGRAALDWAEAAARARGLPELALTSTPPARAFWLGQGFVPVADPALAAKLASYGEGMTYMVRPVTTP
jgi:GNAT superfamily N-acetyltransferase